MEINIYQGDENMELTRLQEVILVRLKLGIPTSEYKIFNGEPNDKEIKAKWLEAVIDLKNKGLITYETRTDTPFEGELYRLALTSKGKIEAEKYHGYQLQN